MIGGCLKSHYQKIKFVQLPISDDLIDTPLYL